ncbi:MAG: hypothetical protein JNL09_04495, partial [Anaerolineales bacterium]|nr:hypothetical protein [Anaerolineales bacterium]
MLRNPINQIEDPTQKKLVQFRLILAGVILIGVLLCSGVILGGLMLQGAAEAPAKATEQASFDSVKPLKELCTGDTAGNVAAAEYAPGGGPNRVVVFRSNLVGSTDLSSFYIRTEDYPEAWRAAELEQAALVACVSANSYVVEECAYTLEGNKSGVLQRIQLTALVNVYAARTGQLVGQKELAGSVPRDCQDTEQFIG